MVKTLVEVLMDDLDGSEAVESVRLGWNGQWRELDLSEKNLAALSKTFDKFWDAARPVKSPRSSRRRSRQTTSPARVASDGQRDPKAIREWAHSNGIPVPSRGRIPGEVEQQYNQATGRT
jgi:nucleoid-associated protein Lsr2